MMEPLSEARTDRDALASPPFPPAGPGASRAGRIQFWSCLAVTVALLVYLLWTPAAKRSEPGVAAASSENQVELTATGDIRIQRDSPLQKKLQSTTVRPTRIAAAELTVTGTVVASLRPDKGKGRFWQFSSPELLTAYTDWQKAVADIAFARKQLDAIQQLADNRVSAQGTLVKRLKKLVEAGTDTDKDLAAAQTELLQAQIEGRKDVHEAETGLRVAQRSEAALSRQLQQAGVDSELLRNTAVEVDVVVADVPEALMSRVKLGQGCEARFVGVAGKHFSGNVRALSPVLSKERRSLRVLFSIDDPDDVLRPGMFADIGLGTDAREALLVPLAGVVHVGRTDYMLVRSGGSAAPEGSWGDWRVTAVQVGEVQQSGAARGAVEVLGGLRAGDVVLSEGAILLKPVVVEVLQRLGARGKGDA